MTWLNHRQAVPISIGMTLFPSAFRIDRPRALRDPARSDHVLRNLVKHLLVRRRPSAMSALSVVAAPADATPSRGPSPA